jgi:ligand-binding SRPBCC domain-containing protein
MSRIELRTAIRAPRERCFDLARSVELHMRSTADTGETAIAGRTSGLLGAGEEVTWRARHFGVWLTLTSRITGYERPAFFCDSMVRGAFARLEHEHRFTEDGMGGTIMDDVLEFTAPGGVIGLLAERLVLRRYLRKFLVARNHALAAVAESDDWRRFVLSP